jgi:hypothetical protein
MKLESKCLDSSILLLSLPLEEATSKFCLNNFSSCDEC